MDFVDSTIHIASMDHEHCASPLEQEDPLDISKEIVQEQHNDILIKRDCEKLYEVKKEIDIEPRTENEETGDAQSESNYSSQGPADSCSDSSSKNENDAETEVQPEYNCDFGPMDICSVSLGADPSSSLEKYKCEVCKRLFITIPDLVEHSKIHENASMKKFASKNCDEIFTFQDSYNHMRGWRMKRASNEMKEKNYSCEVCGKVFSYKQSLNNHLRAIHNESKHECEVCQKVYTCKRYLDRHIKYIHAKVNEYECDICHKVCYYKEALDRHVRAVHNKIKYECDICHKLFSHKCHLTEHMGAVHTKSEHKCEMCHKVFTCERYIKKHVKIVHNKKKQ